MEELEHNQIAENGQAGRYGLAKPETVRFLLQVVYLSQRLICHIYNYTTPDSPLRNENASW